VLFRVFSWIVPWRGLRAIHEFTRNVTNTKSHEQEFGVRPCVSFQTNVNPDPEVHS
jgi:hypothetical protein